MLKIPDENAEVQGVVQAVVTAGTTNSFNLDRFGWGVEVAKGIFLHLFSQI